jgi:hypothetical protein
VKRSVPRSLSDNELLAQIEKIRRREHLSTLEILTHLNEIERRKLHLKLGYSSLFDYCVKHLRYSTSGAGRRVAVARCIARHPEVLDMLRSRTLTVTGVALVASVLRDDNKAEILRSIQNKTQPEIDAIAARYRPPIAMRDRVKPVTVRVLRPRDPVREGFRGLCSAQAAGTCERSGDLTPAEGACETNEALTLAKGACEKSNYSHNGSGLERGDSVTGSHASSNTGRGRLEQKLLIQFLANKDFMKKYEEVRALLSQRLSDTSFENVFGALINEFLERHSPAWKKARRDKRRNVGSGGAKSAPEKTRSPAGKRTHERPCSEAKTATRPQARSRHIPAAVRDEVFVRDKGRCTYVGKTGRRCRSAQALQIDHVEPFTRGGTNTAANLRLLCAKHNRLAAENLFGPGYMKRFRPRE